MRRRAYWYKQTDVSGEPSASVFQVEYWRSKFYQVMWRHIPSDSTQLGHS